LFIKSLQVLLVIEHQTFLVALHRLCTGELPSRILGQDFGVWDLAERTAQITGHDYSIRVAFLVLGQGVVDPRLQPLYHSLAREYSTVGLENLLNRPRSHPSPKPPGASDSGLRRKQVRQMPLIL
jgi:hypothetical protein